MAAQSDTTPVAQAVVAPPKPDRASAARSSGAEALVLALIVDRRLVGELVVLVDRLPPGGHEQGIIRLEPLGELLGFRAIEGSREPMNCIGRRA